MIDVNVIPDMIADPSAFEDDVAFRLKAAQAAIRRECGWHVMPNAALSGVINSRGGTVDPTARTSCDEHRIPDRPSGQSTGLRL